MEAGDLSSFLEEDDLERKLGGLGEELEGLAVVNLLSVMESRRRAVLEENLLSQGELE